eukprot:CAMPEP_0119011634 /NCGR_PEP_ID=MMETSP1176-20130426/5798_1 /TAXON_ID=265551 /ORGANISM="Synedropsis recta cf, Strain CCMP1620" /LENGTH=216 /DNA_ID=CAMNT_0006964489 /DNA_START=55 /DNA_END=705 /DNA_ORIENTATION=+
MKFAATLLLGLGAASALDLTADNFDSATAGKSVFLKFFAPWCGHCKKLKPDWDKLMDAFADSPTALVADVDCTEGGKPLCDANGVKGYPTLKFGDPNNLEDYKGGRDYDSLKKFAEEQLKPSCSPANIDLCDDEKKAEIKKFSDMSDVDLDKLIKDKEQEMEDAEKTFKDAVQTLQDTYSKLSTDKEEALESIKAAGLGLAKAVKATKASSGNDEL